MRRLWPLLLLVSCATLEAPRPEARPGTHRGWDLPASTLVVPLRVPQNRVAAWGEQMVPPTLEGHGTGQRTLAAWFLKHDWHYWWSYRLVRTPLSLDFDHDRLRVSAGLSGDLTAGWDTLPGEISTRVEAKAGVETPLSVAPDWRLEAHPKVFLDVQRAEVPIGISWNGNFFGETISVTESVREALAPSLDELESGLGRWVAGIDLRSGVERAWKALQEPRELGETGLWFSLAPEAVAMGSIHATRDDVGLDLVLRARPTLTLGSRPSVMSRPLPDAESASSPEQGMVIHLPVTLEWSEASRLVEKGPLSLDSGRVLVRALTASAQGDRVLVKLDAGVTPPWSTRVDAVLWLSGRPVWRADTQTLQVVDLELDVRTRDFLTQAAAWLLTPGWVAELQKILVWNLGPRLDDLRTQANAALSSLPLGHQFRLQVQVQGLEVVDFAVSSRGAEFLTRLRSEALVEWVP